MCNYIQIQYHCGHFRFPVLKWCHVYERTHKRCPPNVTCAEWRSTRLTKTADCRPVPKTAWESMINRSHQSPYV
ncbi:uncharacterized protein B0I36DRAFT_342273 [Microdochium trichocladiopsis]|uniref:Uncharacterized protein n=1 Tax=Microdochium trichocladiopsis TaxID=1682393 RepID=A0A9P9BH94_9PEZI|nr:uncharacterized protein B0I36DRAFT_342273 [Microdochium trichocladiopsis]KAH7009404.1 hypothetical protein B0I36DRAFT_342273 [Microdochium trichocladiopsis]